MYHDQDGEYTELTTSEAAQFWTAIIVSITILVALFWNVLA